MLYLLDGLDEVRSVEDRAKVARWIDKARTGCPDSYFMVTCRYAGYTGGARLSSEFLELHLRPLVLVDPPPREQPALVADLLQEALRIERHAA